MTWRSPFIALALTGFAFAGVQPLPVEDPQPCVVKNATSGMFGDIWSIRVATKPEPVGIIKVYDMDNNMLGAMQGPGDCFNLKPGQTVKVAICPEPKDNQGVVALSLDFAKTGKKDEVPSACATMSFKQTAALTATPRPAAFEAQTSCGKVKVDQAAYLSETAETPFLTLGKN